MLSRARHIHLYHVTVISRCGNTVAVDGSLFNKHPRMHEWMDQALQVFPKHAVTLHTADTLMVQELGVGGVKLKSQPDGSGIGAAVTAAA